MMFPTVPHTVIRLAEMLVSAVWIGAALAGIASLVLRCVPALSARSRSLLWLLTFSIAVILPIIMMLVPMQGTGPVSSPHVRVGVAWSLPVVALWIALASVRIAGLVRAAVYLRGVVRRSLAAKLPVNVVAWFTGLGLHRRVQVRASGEVDRPSVVGYLRPTILLPKELPGTMSEDELRQVLLHEVQHVQRLDDCVNLLQKTAVAVFPFSPALLWMERRLCLERELACDDAVLQDTDAPRAYASCLTRIAENRLRSRFAHLAVAAVGRQSELSRRVYRILQWPPRQASRWVYGAVPALLLCGLGAATVGLQRFGVPVAFEAAPTMTMSAANERIVPAVAGLPAYTEAVQKNVAAKLTQASFRLPETQIHPHKNAHFNRSTVKVGHPVQRSLALKSVTGGRTSTQGRAAMHQPVEQLIEYNSLPTVREQAPLFQQISLPYAVIPAGDVWLIVQL